MTPGKESKGISASGLRPVLVSPSPDFVVLVGSYSHGLKPALCQPCSGRCSWCHSQDSRPGPEDPSQGCTRARPKCEGDAGCLCPGRINSLEAHGAPLASASRADCLQSILYKVEGL